MNRVFTTIIIIIIYYIIIIHRKLPFKQNTQNTQRTQNVQFDHKSAKYP